MGSRLSGSTSANPTVRLTSRGRRAVYLMSVWDNELMYAGSSSMQAALEISDEFAVPAHRLRTSGFFILADDITRFHAWLRAAFSMTPRALQSDRPGPDQRLVNWYSLLRSGALRLEAARSSRPARTASTQSSGISESRRCGCVCPRRARIVGGRGGHGFRPRRRAVRCSSGGIQPGTFRFPDRRLPHSVRAAG